MQTKPTHSILMTKKTFLIEMWFLKEQAENSSVELNPLDRQGEFITRSHRYKSLQSTTPQLHCLEDTSGFLFVDSGINQSKCCNLLKCNGVPRIKNS